MTQHVEWHSTAGDAFTIDVYFALIDTGNGSDLVLQVFVGERKLFTALKIAQPGFEHQCLIGLGQEAVDAIVGTALSSPARK